MDHNDGRPPRPRDRLGAPHGTVEPVELGVGERRELALIGCAGADHAWSARCLDQADVAGVSIRTGPSDPAAGPGREYVVIESRRPGSACWRLELSRSSGPRMVVQARILQITVRPARGSA